MYSVAGHGKGETDHLGALTKVAIRRDFGAGSFFANSEDMFEFFNKKLIKKLTQFITLRKLISSS